MNIADEIDLKAYLLERFDNNKHKDWSLLDIYVNDPPYFTLLKKKNHIIPKALQFIDNNYQELKKAARIPTYGFRKFFFEQLIDEFLKGSATIKNSKENTQSQLSAHNKHLPDQVGEKKIRKNNPLSLDKKNTNQILNLYCPIDLKKMSCIKCEHTKYNGQYLYIPIYQCETCGRKYSSNSQLPDMVTIKLRNQEFTNIQVLSLNQAKIYESHAKFQQLINNKCYVYDTSSINRCKNPSCKNEKLIKVHYEGEKRAKENPISHDKICPKCGTLYVTIVNYLNRYSNFHCINYYDLSKIKNEYSDKYYKKQRKKENRYKQRQADKKRAQQKAIDKRRAQQKAFEKKQAQQKANSIKQLHKLMRFQKKTKSQEKIIMERYLSRLNEQSKTDKTNYEKNKETVQTEDLNDIATINVKDFIVRRNVFKCRHNDHQLQNVNASISLINSKGEVISQKVAAGYCPKCKMYFIMESIYENLIKKGTPICRTNNEKSYLKEASYENDIQLASESILMQYGYNVSQKDGLTEARRQKILAIMIDHQILTKNEIINYLDFFIRQRQNNPKFEIAISKWKTDREFVSNYRLDDYQTYGVNSISRKY